ncbi:MAG: CapA family protein [Alphaproteobacteria bacterium]|nr:CapA family protein [Alphaproteobacteria bacterium]
MAQLYDSEAGNFTITLGGDTMLTRKLTIYSEPRFLGLAKLFRESDVGFVNLEGCARYPDEGLPGITRGTFMTTPPPLLEDLKWFGVNMVSCANNHAFDYGEDGMMANNYHLDDVGIAHSGSGRNMSEARAPAYLETPNGRVGVVSATATYRPWNAAAVQRPDLPGRPGVNPLANGKTYRVDGKAFAELVRMSKGLGFDMEKTRARGHFYSDKEVPHDAADRIDIFGERFEKANGFATRSHADSDDLEENLRWIREARRQADWVVFSLHYHEFGGKSLAKAKTRTEVQEPADFVIGVAHAAIDAGADLFVGHGSHIPLGIEIYKGKPILYSTGNMIFQNETVRFFPDEAYRRFDLGPDATPADFLDARTGGGTKGHVAHEGFWENIVVRCTYRKGALAEIRVYPIEQGFGRPRPQRGRPMLAEGAVAKRVLGRIKKISKQYGTDMRITGNAGVIRVGGTRRKG